MPNIHNHKNVFAKFIAEKKAEIEDFVEIKHKSKIHKAISSAEKFFMKQWDKLIDKILSLAKSLEKKISKTKKVKVKQFRDVLEKQKFNKSLLTKIKTKINKVKKEANEIINEFVD